MIREKFFSLCRTFLSETSQKLKKKRMISLKMREPGIRLSEQELAFTLLSASNPVLFTDGKMLLEINPTNTARVGLKLYAADWTEVIKKLAKFKNNTSKGFKTLIKFIVIKKCFEFKL